MKPSTLLAIKQAIAKFVPVYETLIVLWNGELVHGNDAIHPETIQIGVILSNLAFISTNTYEYNHDEAVAELEKYIEVLRIIDEYHDKCYMTHYPYNEIRFIYDGFYMSEAYEKVESFNEELMD